MNFLSRLLLHFVVFPIGILIFIFISDGYFPGFKYEISKKITQKNIKALKLNMSEKEVIKILGDPIIINRGSIYNSDYVFEYSKSYIAGIYVQLSFENKKLIAWHIEDSNDNTIYACSKKICPYINQCIYDKVIPIEELDKEEAI